jgi:hypothetical protein
LQKVVRNEAAGFQPDEEFSVEHSNRSDRGAGGLAKQRRQPLQGVLAYRGDANHIVYGKRDQSRANVDCYQAPPAAGLRLAE